jgi:hypothetical protein
MGQYEWLDDAMACDGCSNSTKGLLGRAGAKQGTLVRAVPCKFQRAGTCFSTGNRMPEYDVNISYESIAAWGCLHSRLLDKAGARLCSLNRCTCSVRTS